MARRVNANPGTNEPQDDLSDAPPMPGGAPGVIEGATSSIVEPGKPTTSIPTAPHRPELADMPPPKRYVVERGGRVHLGGYGVEIKVGKIVEDSTHDLAQLRRQGIVLKEV